MPDNICFSREDLMYTSYYSRVFRENTFKIWSKKKLYIEGRATALEGRPAYSLLWCNVR